MAALSLEAEGVVMGARFAASTRQSCTYIQYYPPSPISVHTPLCRRWKSISELRHNCTPNCSTT